MRDDGRGVGGVRKTERNKGLHPVMRLLISVILAFAVWQSVVVLVLGFFGETTLGVITSYHSRLDDNTAAPNRSRTISKGYLFTVKGREYKGHVIYKGDEAWPSLGASEVRRERISYLAILPQINKPTMLVEIDVIGPMGFIYHILAIPGCAFLFLLVNGYLARGKSGRKTLSTQSNARGDNTMFCTNCGAKLPEGAAFCANCGGAANVTSQASEPPSQSYKPSQDQRAAVGWSYNSNHPEILAAAQKNKKSAMGCAWIFMLIFPIGFLLAGLFVDEMPLNEAIIIGVGLGVVMLVINLVRIKGMKRPIWEGVVSEKFQKKRRRHNRGDDSFDYYTEFTVVIKTDAGKVKRIIERDSQRHMYDYLVVGDRVRYYPAFETYEKYDKSQDKIIYCNVCRMMNPIANDRCKRCNNLLFK